MLCCGDLGITKNLQKAEYENHAFMDIPSFISSLCPYHQLAFVELMNSVRLVSLTNYMYSQTLSFDL